MTRHHSKACLAIALAFCVACASAPSYGTFVPDRGPAIGVMAADAARRLSEDHADDSRKVYIHCPPGDPFGKRLSDSLRQEGFDVQQGPGAPSDRTVIRFTVDQTEGTRMLQVTLFSGSSRVMSRAYRRSAQGLQPSGPWTVQHRGGA